jgi:hypothetical protein
VLARGLDNRTGRSIDNGRYATRLSVKSILPGHV